MRLSRLTSADGAEVVGLPGVGPLLGAGGHEPRVALGRRALCQRRGEGDDRADAGRVVVGAGGGRDAVGMRHDDDQAPRRDVADADHVSGGPLAGHGEPLGADSQPRVRGTARRRAGALARSACDAAGRGPGLCQLDRERVRLGGDGVGGGAAAPAVVAALTAAMRAGSIERERTSAGAAQSCDARALFGHARRGTVGGCPPLPRASVGFVGICPTNPTLVPMCWSRGPPPTSGASSPSLSCLRVACRAARCQTACATAACTRSTAACTRSATAAVARGPLPGGRQGVRARRGAESRRGCRAVGVHDVGRAATPR